MWNNTYQNLCDSPKDIIKMDTAMALYNKK